ncbi:MAG: hypothetical protein JWL65_3759, partial [Gammaproteobacteria bacterium]|nr:hypothetical protein [Gammaproteobacteria bacterium]
MRRTSFYNADRRMLPMPFACFCSLMLG